MRRVTSSEAQSVTLDINNLDEIAPSITSGATATAINENTGASQVIYTATADDSLDISAGVTFSLTQVVMLRFLLIHQPVQSHLSADA
jgi:hypothetical protein